MPQSDSEPSAADDSVANQQTWSRNFRLKLAYDGSAYHGWQIQQDLPSIQAELERAVFSMTGEKTVVESSGRTDAGVHAAGQVANFKSNSRLPAHRFRLGLQSYLPPDIVVLEVEEVPLTFHARFQAKRKRYRYLIDNHPAPLPFLKKYAWHYHSPLDVAAMHASAQALHGTHDFRSFECHWPNKLSSVRTIFEISVRRLSGWSMWHQSDSLPAVDPASNEEGGYVCLDVVGDGFLYNMVRSIMGTLVEVGRGKAPPDEMHRVLTSLDRRTGGITAPAHGLYLVSVGYDE
ncbi:MAG: tRNA pseudouridine(38-40) synthase TruA [Planctomycetaceae bacterium]|nr:tRNA pseudouridine(38-40) synthase TruA [Planctomycetaceae bacterium]